MAKPRRKTTMMRAPAGARSLKTRKTGRASAAKGFAAMTTSANGRKPRAKSQPLPGMEDSAIIELENIATEYADIRDRRMELTQEESTLKTTALQAMKKHGKTIYKHGGVTIQIIPGEEDVKVRVKKAGDDEDESQAAEERTEFAEERAAAVNAED